MKRAELEARVLAAVDALRRGEKIEDDLIECKRVWPDPVKAPRQLAGAANRAAGEAIVWIVGVDERSGAIDSRGADDPAGWWAQVSKRFDQQTVPDLLHQLTVYVGAEETVVALAFGTDRAPYLVTTPGGGSPEREVPIRDGTGTRSAYRHELLRILTPAISVPPADLLSADLTARWQPRRHEGASEENTSLSGLVHIFVEHVGGVVVVLPAHQMRGTLAGAGLVLPLHVQVFRAGLLRDSDASTPPQFGVSTRGGDVVCTGPGRFRADPRMRVLGDQRGQWSDVPAWRLELEFGVAGSNRPLRLSADLHRQAIRRPAVPSADLSVDVGRWSTT